MAKKKSWKDKLNDEKREQLKPLEKDFWGYHIGDIMLIATPKIIENYVQQIPSGKITTPEVMRKDLAIEFNATFTCPMTSGIFLRIVAEAAYEEFLQNGDATKITPFWRIIEPESKLASKLTFGENFIKEMRSKEREILD
ncbi:MAG: hypothetical protein RJA52_757 [Bacteroidota bacterium]|jgi:hypothetical protein